jgi:hypothetical protein
MKAESRSNLGTETLGFSLFSAVVELVAVLLPLQPTTKKKGITREKKTE